MTNTKTKKNTNDEENMHNWDDGETVASCISGRVLPTCQPSIIEFSALWLIFPVSDWSISKHGVSEVIVMRQLNWEVIFIEKKKRVNVNKTEIPRDCCEIFIDDSFHGLRVKSEIGKL